MCSGYEALLANHSSVRIGERSYQLPAFNGVLQSAADIRLMNRRWQMATAGIEIMEVSLPENIIAILQYLSRSGGGC